MGSAWLTVRRCRSFALPSQPHSASALLDVGVEKVRDRNVFLAAIIAARRVFPLPSTKWQLPQ
jgi:hypothetical protein